MTDKFEEKGIDLTKAQIIALLILSKQDGLPQQRLATITNRDKASLARLLHTMERKGYILRKTDANDKRIKHVYITSIGEEIIGKALPVFEEVLATIQEDISDHELATATQVLQKILKNIKAVTKVTALKS